MNVISAKMAGGSYLATSKDIPDAGDFWMDPKTNNGKIGDGKTPMFELPWINFLGVDLSTETPRKYKISDKVKSFIEEYIDLIEENRFDEVYAIATMRYSSIEFLRNFTRALLEAGINPEPYLTTVPTCIQDLLLALPPNDTIDYTDNKIYTHDYVNYGKADVNATFELVKQQIARACCIPDHILKVGGLE